MRGGDQFHIRRTLWGGTLTQWDEIENMCADVTLSDEKDKLTWSLSANGQFSVKSFYNLLIINDMHFPYKLLCKIKVPPKIRVFVWLLIRNSVLVLTKDNLLKRGWSGNPKCICYVVLMKPYFFIAQWIHSFGM